LVPLLFRLPGIAGVYQWSQAPQTLEQAFAPAQKAIALDDSLAFAHAILGNVYAWKKQHDQAVAEGERAIILAPNWADGHVWLAQILILAGRPADAIGLVEKAMRLNPQYPAWYSGTLGWAYRFTRRYEEAITVLKQTLAGNPNDLGAHMNLAATYSELDRMEEARAEVAEMLRISPNFSLEVLRRINAQKDPVLAERSIEALRKAG